MKYSSSPTISIACVLNNAPPRITRVRRPPVTLQITGTSENPSFAIISSLLFVFEESTIKHVLASCRLQILYYALTMSSRSFLYDHERKNDKKAKQWGNFDLDYSGDLASSAPLTDHARQRMKERNIPLKDIKKHGVQTAHGVVVTAYRKNEIDFNRNAAQGRHMIHGTLPASQQHQHDEDRGPGRATTSSRQSNISKEIKVSREMVGMIIGAKGETIKKMRKQHGISILVKGDRNSKSSFRHICLHGPQEKVLLVEQKYLSWIHKGTERRNPPNKNEPGMYTEEIQVPRVMVKRVIFGQTRQTIRRMEEKYKKSGIRFWMNPDKPDDEHDLLTMHTRRLFIRGDIKEEVLAASSEYQAIINEASTCKREMEVPKSKYGLFLRGKGDKMRKEWLKGGVYIWLEQTTSADDSNEFSKLHIRGSEEALVIKAYKEYKELMKL